jgi:hypothetical protein
MRSGVSRVRLFDRRSASRDGADILNPVLNKERFEFEACGSCSNGGEYGS